MGCFNVAGFDEISWINAPGGRSDRTVLDGYTELLLIRVVSNRHSSFAVDPLERRKEKLRPKGIRIADCSIIDTSPLGRWRAAPKGQSVK